jgi:hypothetical protein
LAARLRKEASDQPAAQVDHVFKLAFGRAPSVVEHDASLTLVQRHGLRALCRALLNSSELIYVD